MDPYVVGIVKRDPAVEAFGEPVIWLVDEFGVGPRFDELPVDADLAQLLGWDTVPQDDDGNPYVVLGIARNKKGVEILVTCKIVHRPGDMETMHGVGYILTAEQSVAVREWIYRVIPKRKIVRRHKKIIEGQFRTMGVDDKTIARRRKKILREDRLGQLELEG